MTDPRTQQFAKTNVRARYVFVSRAACRRKPHNAISAI